jgi:hypothetical protein
MTRDDIIRMAKQAAEETGTLVPTEWNDPLLERFAALVAAEKDKEIERLESERNATVKALLCDAERHLIGICDVTNFMSDEVAALLNRIRTVCAARGET